MLQVVKDIETFTSINFGEVRAAVINNRAAFIGNDVARALGYKNPDNAVKRHCKKPLVLNAELKSISRYNTEYMRTIPVTFIYEPDIYILVMRSKLDSAQQFVLWIAEDILPSIREHNAAVGDPEKLTSTDLEYLAGKNPELAKEYREAMWFSEIGRYLANAPDDEAVTIDEFSKMISDEIPMFGPNQIRSWLLEKKYTYIQHDRHLPAQWAIKNKLLIYKRRGTGRPIIQITPKGQFRLIQELCECQQELEKRAEMEQFAKEYNYSLDRNGTLRDKDDFMVLKEVYPGALDDTIKEMKNGSKNK